MQLSPPRHGGLHRLVVASNAEHPTTAGGRAYRRIRPCRTHAHIALHRDCLYDRGSAHARGRKVASPIDNLALGWNIFLCFSSSWCGSDLFSRNPTFEPSRRPITALPWKALSQSQGPLSECSPAEGPFLRKLKRMHSQSSGLNEAL